MSRFSAFLAAMSLATPTALAVNHAAVLWASARVDAEHAKCVVLLTEEWVDYPNYPASIARDQVDLIVQVDEVGDPQKLPRVPSV